jgi:hypothetical protein
MASLDASEGELMDTCGAPLESVFSDGEDSEKEISIQSLFE